MIPTATQALSSQSTGGNPFAVRAYRWRMHIEVLEAYWAAQSASCACCYEDFAGKPEAQMDHDHSHCPGKRGCAKCFRGFVCSRCNQAICWVESDKSKERWAMLAEQLRRRTLAREFLYNWRAGRRGQP